MNRLALCALVSIAFLCGRPARAADDYKPGPDSERKEGVPRGAVTQPKFNDSKIYPGIERDYWVYVPAQYTPDKPACVMVFQDGGGFQDPNGSYRVPVVFDNLIHRKEMPVTIGIFINPGAVPAAGADGPGGTGNTESTARHPRYNRSFEYDTPSDQYVRFLVEEILPEVGKSWKLTDDPNGRAISGASSPNGSSISGRVKMPTLCTSAPSSSSHNSMCDEASRISRGPLRVPGTYEVVRSTGTGSTTTRDSSNDVGCGSAPPKTSGAPWS